MSVGLGASFAVLALKSAELPNKQAMDLLKKMPDKFLTNHAIDNSPHCRAKTQDLLRILKAAGYLTKTSRSGSWLKVIATD